MISDPNLILYACISKGTTILAEFSSGDRDLENLALQCLEKIPPLHSTFSHTIRNKIYNFLMDEPFVYFTILDESYGKPQGFEFLEFVKDSFLNILTRKSIKVLDNLTSHCFHEELSPIFRSLMLSGDAQNHSLDSRSSGKKVVSVPLFGKPSKHSKKKKKKKLTDAKNEGVGDIPIEKKLDVSDVVNVSREFSVTLQKNGSYEGHKGRHKDSQNMWRRHVWTVLVIDLVVCFVLFGVWLLICKGFECLSS